MVNRERLNRIWSHINKVRDWNDREFCIQKAFVSAIFADAAYLHIPSHELDESRRVKILPCYEHERLVGLRKTFDILRYLREGDFGDVFVIDSVEDAVVVGVRTPFAIFVATRGTAVAEDYIIDLKYLTKACDFSGSGMKFHRGFLGLSEELWGELEPKLDLWGPGRIPIYFVGHSLGGAVSAILNAFSQNQQKYNSQAYVFGMPRFCKKETMKAIELPNTVVNSWDPFPKTPWNCAKYPITLNIPRAPFLSRRPILQQHAIEHYCIQIEQQAK